MAHDKGLGKLRFSKIYGYQRVFVLNYEDIFNNVMKKYDSISEAIPRNLDEFKSAVYDFRSYVAMYVLHVDALDGEGESLKDKL